MSSSLHRLPECLAVAMHLTIHSSLRFWVSVPTSQGREVWYSAGCLATQAYLETRPLTLLLNQSLYMGPWHLLELSALMFPPPSITLSHLCGKTIGLIHRVTNFWLWSHPYKCGILPSVPSGKRKLCSHFSANTWPFAALWASTCLCQLWCHTFCWTAHIMANPAVYIISTAHSPTCLAMPAVVFLMFFIF
jgi:hypothetical protein